MIRVAIVDDHAIVRTGLRHFFSEHVDLQVTGEAANGREAVDLARDHHPDLIILDMMMPVMSGYEAIAELRADDATCTIPIVGLSAKAMATDMERATDVGIDGYITKPFRIAQVLSVIEGYL